MISRRGQHRGDGRQGSPPRRGARALLRVGPVLALMAITVWTGCMGDEEGAEPEPEQQYAGDLRPGDLEGLPDPFFAVAPQVPLESEDLEEIAAAEVDAVREFAVWAMLDPEAPAGDYDWSSFDERVELAARERIQVLPFLFGTPAWVARDLDGNDCDECTTFAPRSAKALAAWKDFTHAAAERYGPDGSFWKENPSLPQLPIREWQLWNEQNSPTFYQPKPDVEAFADLIVAGDEGIKAADPGATTVLGGMFGTPLQGRKPALTAWDFLAGLYALEGVRDHFDAVSAHPYAAKPKGVREQVEGMRDEMVEAGDADSELWITELGWSSESEGNPLNRGPEGQAEQLGETYSYLLRERRALNLGPVIWFSWRDTENEICAWCPGSGLVSTDLEPKPALEALTEFTRAADAARDGNG